MKELGYRLFAILYRIFCIFPIKDKHVFLVMTHDAGPEGNVALMRDYMKACDKEYQFCTFKREDSHFGRSIKKMWRFFVVYSYCLARSKYVLLDNMFLPMAYMKFRPEVKVVQMWHGTGVIKKIGADINTGKLKELEYRANQNNTHLIVSSEITKKIYSRSFSMTEDKTFITGMPRSDIYFQPEKQKELLARFYEQYPECEGKKLILYAPTFRDSQVSDPVIELDYEALAEYLGKDYVVGLRLHPFVAKNYVFSSYTQKENAARIISFSNYDSLNTLLFASDMLISDYSSIVFEYAALKRPILFFAYDLEEFEKEGRGFYWNYEEYVPGPVVRTNEELKQKITEFIKDREGMLAHYGMEQFVNDTYTYQDGMSRKRIYHLMSM